MRKKLWQRSFIPLVLACVLLLAPVRTFAADSALVFGSNGQFAFDFVSGDSLFNISGILPGDSITNTISLENNNTLDIDLYIHAQSADRGDFGSDAEKEMSDRLCDQLRLLVQRETASGSMQTIYDGWLSGRVNSAFGDAPDGMLSEIYLGNYTSNTAGDLVVTVSMPESAGNEFMGATSKIQWIFRAYNEEIDPVPSPDPPDLPIPTPSGTGSGGGGGAGAGAGQDIDRVSATAGLTTIADDEVPLAGGDLFTIEDENVPLASLPFTGTMSVSK